MFPSRGCRGYCLLGSSETIDRDGAGFRAAVEADPAPGAVRACIACGMNSIGAQLRRQFQTLGWAALHAQSAAFALFHIDRDFTARWPWHVHLVTAFILCGRCSHLVFSQYSYSSSRNFG